MNRLLFVLFQEWEKWRNISNSHTHTPQLNIILLRFMVVSENCWENESFLEQICRKKYIPFTNKSTKQREGNMWRKRKAVK